MTCLDCRQSKPVDAFHARERVCKPCSNARRRRQYAAAPPMVGSKVSDTELAKGVNLRAAWSETSRDWHWRYEGPRRLNRGRRAVYDRLAQLTNGYRLPQPVSFWCWAEYPWCVNPDHATPHGDVVLVDDREVFNPTKDGTADPRFQIVTDLNSVDFLPEHPDWKTLSLAGDRFLRAHGFNSFGQPLRQRGRYAPSR